MNRAIEYSIALIALVASTALAGYVEIQAASPLRTSLLIASLTCLVVAALIVIRRAARWYRRMDITTTRIREENTRLQRQQRALLELAKCNAQQRSELRPTISHLLEVAARTLEVERAAYWVLSPGSEELRCFDLYLRSRNQHTIARPVYATVVPSLFAALRDQRAWVVNDIRQGSLAPELAQLAELGYTAIMNAPVRFHGTLCGLLCVADKCGSREWQPEDQHFIGSLADMLALILHSHEQAQLSEELEQRSQAIEAAMDGMAILDSSQRYVYVNRAHALIYGYSDPEELLGQSWTILYSEQELRRFEEKLMPLFAQTGQLQVEACGKRRDGTIFPQEISLTALSNGGLICVVRDTTARKEMEQQARRKILHSKRFLRRVIDSVPALIYVKDPDRRYTLANQAIATFYDTTVNKMLWRRDHDIVNQSLLADELAKIDERERIILHEHGAITSEEEERTDARGQKRILQVMRCPLRLSDEEPAHLLGVAIDITEMKRLQEDLLHTQKMDAVGQLAGGVAHDFNNLLTGILGCTGMIKMTQERNIELIRVIDTIESAAQRAGQLTKKLLGFARKGKHQTVPVDLHATIDETMLLLRRTLEKNIAIVQRLQAPSAFILGDPTQLQQVVLNLAINARDAMSPESNGSNGGELVVATRVVPAQTACGGSENEELGNFVELTVQDTGCGMSDEVRDRIFEPFFTTKPLGRGTGMGLAMVYGIVKGHDGFIRVESTVGQGTTIRIYLPCLEGYAIQNTLPVTRDPVVGRGQIMVVDDHHIVRAVTARMLTSLGYSVVTAQDGVEAIDLYREHAAEIDLVLLDMVMPRMGARECFRIMRQINPQIRVILSTGYVNNNVVQEIMNEGMRGFIQKPYQIHELSRMIAEVMAARFQSSPEKHAAGSV